MYIRGKANKEQIEEAAIRFFKKADLHKKKKLKEKQ